MRTRVALEQNAPVNGEVILGFDVTAKKAGCPKMPTRCIRGIGLYTA